MVLDGYRRLWIFFYHVGNLVRQLVLVILHTSVYFYAHLSYQLYTDLQDECDVSG